MEDGEYYHTDVIGLDVVSTDGEAIGRVVAIDNFGAGDVIEIERPSGGRQARQAVHDTDASLKRFQNGMPIGLSSRLRSPQSNALASFNLFSREGGSPVWVPAFAGKQLWVATTAVKRSLLGKHVADGRRGNARFPHSVADLVQPLHHIACREQAGD